MARDSLIEVLFNYYSIDEIKTAKETLCDILKKEYPTRKEPGKKRKELNDIYELFIQWMNTKSDVIFVANDYRKLPPVGLEFIAPILNNLIDQVAQINLVLPKIVDIKTEVVNTADTVRSCKSNISDLDDKILILSNKLDNVTSLKDNNVTSDKSNFKTPSSENNNNKLSTERRVSNK